MPLATCPNATELRDFRVGKTPADDARQIAEHLDACPACQSSIETIDDAADTLVHGLRQPLTDEFDAEPDLQKALVAVEALGTQLLSQTPLAQRPAGGDNLPGALRDYHLLEKLGEGGMGTVYKARHQRLKRVVALKVLPQDRTRDKQAVARFEREMEAVGKLEHANVVRALDAGEHEGTHYLVMEYVDGLDLSQLVKRRGPLAVADACELVRQAAAALQCAHEHNLVHRDIKPSNLMLTATGQVKLLDLGLALLLAEQPGGEELTGTSQMMGTADYCAPEQAGDSHKVDIRADIYSLGCTLYKLLTGHAPFTGEAYQSNVKKLMAHMTQPVPAVRDRRAEVSQGLAKILDRMLAKSPAARYASPAEVFSAIEPFAKGSDLKKLFADASQRADLALATMGQTSETTPYLGASLTGTHPSGDVQAAVENHANKKPPRRIGLIAAAAAAFVLMTGVVIIIRHKGGGETRINSSDAEGVDVKGDNGETLVSVTTSKPAEPNKQPKPDSKPATPASITVGDAAASMSISALVGRPSHLKGLKTWTIETRRHRNAIHDVAFSPDNSLLATAASDGNVRLWDIHSHQLRKVFFGESRRLDLVSWSPDGRKLAAADSVASVFVWDVESGKMERSIPRVVSGLARLAWTPDSKALALGGGFSGRDGHGVTVWEVASDQLRFKLPNRAGICAWSPEGDRLAVDSMRGNGGMVVVWDAQSGQERATFQAVENGLSALAWSPDSKFLAVAGENSTQARILDADTGQMVQTLANSSGSPITELAWSPQGDRFAMVGGDLRFWDPVTWQPLGSVAPAQRGLKWSDDGQTVAALADQGVCLFNVGQRQMTTRFSVLQGTGYVFSSHLMHRYFAWSRDGKQIALRSGPASVGIWDTTTAGAVHNFKTKPQNIWCDGMAWSHDGQMLAKSSYDGPIECFDAVSGKPLKELPFSLRSLEFSPDDRLLAGVASSGQLEICDVSSGKAAVAPFGAQSEWAAWSPKGDQIAVREAFKLFVRRTDNGEAVAQFDERTGQITALAWSPDGERLAVGDMDGSAIFLWHPTTGAKRIIEVPATLVISLAFSADGRTLIVAQADNMLRTFDVQSLDLLSAVSFSTGLGLAFSPDLARAASLDGGMALRFGDVSQGSTSGVIMPFSENEWLAIGADGHYRGTPGVEKHLIYVAETDDGEQLILSPEEFSQKFAWQNDPTRVQITALSSSIEQSKPPKSVPKPATPAIRNDRRVAEQVLAIGGKVDWLIGQQRGTASTLDELPKESFTATGIVLDDVSGLPETLIAEIGRLRHLQGINANTRRLDNSHLKQLGTLASLTTLRIGYSQVTSGGLVALVPLKRLRILYVGGLGVSDRGAESIGQLDELEDLGMPDTRLTDAGLAELAKLRHLRTLDLAGASITDRGLQSLSALTDLEELSLRDTRIDGSGLSAIAGLPRLRTLSLRGTNVRDEHLAKLGPLSRLHTLDLRGTKITDQAVAALSSIASLTHIALDGAALSAAGREALGAALPQSNLNGDTIAANREAAEWTLNNGGHLSLIVNGEHVSGAKQLPDVPFDIATIYFTTAPAVDDTVLTRFAKLSNLRDLVIPETSAGDSGLMRLGGLKLLMQIDASVSKMGDATLASFAGCENLRVLTLRGVQAGRSPIPDFDQLPLEGFQFHFGPVSDDFLACLPYQRLSWLVLFFCKNVSDDGLKHLQAAKRLEHLNLIGARLTDTGLAYLAELRKLRELLLGGTRISSAGLTSLSDLKDLEILDLSQTLVGTDLSALAGLDRLCWLNLNDTGIGDESLGHLAGLSDLDHLDLRGTAVTAEGVARLQKALPHCHILTDISAPPVRLDGRPTEPPSATPPKRDANPETP